MDAQTDRQIVDSAEGQRRRRAEKKKNTAPHNQYEDVVSGVMKMPMKGK